MGLEDLAGDGLANEDAVIQDGDTGGGITTGDPSEGNLLISTDDTSGDWYYADGVKGEGELP